MLYETVLILNPAHENVAEAFEFKAFLDNVAGRGDWLILEGPKAADGQGDIRLRLLCPQAALMRLQWADITEGKKRVVSDRPLSDDEIARHRQSFNGRFPWE
ncbi:hypothetical protein [Asticcacaulis sp. EMRT-3]|uniref:hypothetical protein n=1 Tax=Asticcacaulis sp. EMRT-3 TaxID=3040349 RepID=UPI0024AEB3A5|nr:hypothetical protein [Asticcacaulis sp. EMRT-3]MDI7775692.1 hypothetical protein [Asticcacaulis sp. EMRT-3]